MLKQVDSAGVSFFTGGDQLRLTRQLGSTFSSSTCSSSTPTAASTAAAPATNLPPFPRSRLSQGLALQRLSFVDKRLRTTPRPPHAHRDAVRRPAFWLGAHFAS
jgi:hypothetical protein